jgi:hypothetical protein
LWDRPTLLLPNLLHELDHLCHLPLIMVPLGLQILYPLPLDLPLGPLGLLLGPHLLQLSLQHLTPMFQECRAKERKSLHCDE